MSARGRCAECGRRAVEENIMGIHFHKGPAFERWRRGMAACVGAELADSAADNAP